MEILACNREMNVRYYFYDTLKLLPVGIPAKVSQERGQYIINEVVLKVILDTSVVIALLSSETERDAIIDLIDGRELVCPESVTSEIGNAVSAMFKRSRISLEQGKKLVREFQNLKIQLIPLNLERSAEICHQYDIYAYDAYVLECAERAKSDLITLDMKMKDIAEKLTISIIEV